MLAFHARKVAVACAAARARILERHISIKVIGSCRDVQVFELVIRRGILVVVDRHRHVDVDAADVIDDPLKAREIQPHIVGHAYAKVVLDGLDRQCRTTARIVLSFTPEVSGVDPVFLVIGVRDLEPQVTGDRQDAHAHVLGIDRQQHHCVRAARYGFARALVDAKKKDGDPLLVLCVGDDHVPLRRCRVRPGLFGT